jgi:hypothetical protein
MSLTSTLGRSRITYDLVKDGNNYVSNVTMIDNWGRQDSFVNVFDNNSEAKIRTLLDDIKANTSTKRFTDIYFGDTEWVYDKNGLAITFVIHPNTRYQMRKQVTFTGADLQLLIDYLQHIPNNLN